MSFEVAPKSLRTLSIALVFLREIIYVEERELLGSCAGIALGRVQRESRRQVLPSAHAIGADDPEMSAQCESPTADIAEHGFVDPVGNLGKKEIG